MPRILLVEDDPAVRESALIVLQRAGHEVVEATNGRAALELLQARVFDLVITDIIMPEVEGLEVIRAVRSRHPACPVIAMSGGGQIDKGELLGWAQKFGASAVLFKPFSAQALRDAAAACLVPRAQHD